ncbi:MAG: hypothetical protein QOG72_2081 [Sphingomonadales bacterium]|jgi:hypothetical protein|nr:hypothetical protein [Sphingomonadales bacterium]
MPYSVTLPVMAGLSLIGAGSGVYLGRSAIAEINPVHFHAPETRFHADLVPYRSPDWAQVQVGEYQQAALVTGLGDGCIGCRDYPVEYYPRHDPAVDASASAPGPALEFAEAAPEPERDPELARVERYASYPLTADDQAAPESEEPVEEVYAGTE